MSVRGFYAEHICARLKQSVPRIRATTNSITDALADIVITEVTGGVYNIADSKYTGAIFAGYWGYIAEKLELGGTFVYEHASKDILIESSKAGSVSTKIYAILTKLKYN